MPEAKVIMLCPKCKVLMETDTETCDIIPLRMHDSELNITNMIKFNNCNCNENYIYIDEL